MTYYYDTESRLLNQTLLCTARKKQVGVRKRRALLCRPNHISIFVSIPRVGQLVAVLSSIGNESELNTQNIDKLVTLTTIGKEDSINFFCN